MNDERRTVNGGCQWRFSREVTLAVIIQLIFLGSLILGSWLNLQRQLDLLQHDVSRLLCTQEKSQQKLQTLWAQSISHEYRLRAAEERTRDASMSDCSNE